MSYNQKTKNVNRNRYNSQYEMIKNYQNQISELNKKLELEREEFRLKKQEIEKREEECKKIKNENEKTKKQLIQEKEEIKNEKLRLEIANKKLIEDQQVLERERKKLENQKYQLCDTYNEMNHNQSDERNNYYFSYKSYYSYDPQNIDETILNGIKYSNNNNYENYNNYLSKVKPRGLVNLGNCCYMNALLQCLFHIEKLTIGMIKEFQSNHKLKRKEYVSSYYDFVERYLITQCNSFPPEKFKNALISSNKLFANPTGHDSKDVLISILYKLHEQLKEENINIEDDDDDEEIDPKNEGKAYDACCKEYHKDFSIISDIFHWEHKTTSRCSKCKREFFDFINENMFIFNLKEISELVGKNRNNRIDIMDGFKNFKDSEKNGTIYCQDCEEEVPAKIEHLMCSLPHIIAIVLDRGNEKNEYNCKVDFPKKINLSSFVDKKYYHRNLVGNTEYVLHSVTLLYSFHTTAFCRHFDGKYYLFNDTYCKPCTYDQIKNEKPYLLFYKKQ